MAMEKSILKPGPASEHVFDYKPREFSKGISGAAVDYVHGDNPRSKDFLISQLAAQQSGVSQLEEERIRGLVNDQVLEKLKDVEERAYKEAFELGQQEGRDNAFRQEKAGLTEKLSGLDQLLLSIESLKTDLLKTNEAQIVEMAFEIGKRIALRDISQNREAITHLFEQVIADLQSEQRIIVHACAEDVAMIEDLSKRTEATPDSLKKMKLIADPEIHHGGCLIDLEYGQINLTVVDRVDRVWQALEQQLHVGQKRES